MRANRRKQVKCHMKGDPMENVLCPPLRRFQRHLRRASCPPPIGGALSLCLLHFRLPNSGSDDAEGEDGRALDPSPYIAMC